jgi:hypothetical protein
MNEHLLPPVYFPLRKSVYLLVTALTLTAPARSAMTDELSAADRGKLEAGESVLITVEKPGATWPEVRIYRKVKATPEGVTALFLDYENADSFIGNLKSAAVENEPDANTKDVRYTVKLPVIFTISYLVRNRYEKPPGATPCIGISSNPFSPNPRWQIAGRTPW